MADLQEPGQIAGFANTPGRWKPYTAYKSSGVDWLGDIPAHWKVNRLKFVAQLNPDVMPEETHPDYLISYVDITNVDSRGRIVSPQDLRFEAAPSRARRRVKSGDTILSTVRTYLKAIAFIENPAENLTVSTGFAVLRPDRECEPRFLYRLVQSHEFVEKVVAHSEGVGYPAINPSELAALPVWLPSQPEQRAIAAFLDRETAKIDALVAKKERLIALLQEKRAALITHTVTKGLNPSAPMKASGIEWLGDIPAHWEVCRVRDVAASLQTGPFGSQLHSEEYVVGGTPVINPANLRGGRIEADWGCTVDETTRDRLAKHSLSDGDIVFARRGEMGRCELVTQGEAGWLCGTGSLRVRLKEKVVNSRYVSLVLASSGTREWLQLESVGATMENLNTHIIGRIPMVVPPLPEQGEIGVLVERRVAGIDSLTSKVQEHIEHLREYRAAVISAAVTGRIDVRGEVAS